MSRIPTVGVSPDRKKPNARRRDLMSLGDWITLAGAAVVAVVGTFLAKDPGWVSLIPGAAISYVIFSLVKLAARWLKRRSDTQPAPSQAGTTDGPADEEFGVIGELLVDRATDAVARIKGSKAARDGWLGSPQDLDFRADLTFIGDSLRRSTAIRALIAEAETVPNATPADKQMLGSARQTNRHLIKLARQRVDLLERCATEAEELDRELAALEEQRLNTEKREDVQRQLSAMMYCAEHDATNTQASEATDAVRARAAAFRELTSMMHSR